ncbi:hypothetical protein JZ751_006126 [Albula glossodonta]|uniref:Uncharacterized protein n=1 Tax=Albula glossodonta TaxID=121402 RepID=A0A8T2PCG8_9TELE|nr:hypothetical protein JZ751_006126 [Albula glossodonta]
MKGIEGAQNEQVDQNLHVDKDGRKRRVATDVDHGEDFGKVTFSRGCVKCPNGKELYGRGGFAMASGCLTEREKEKKRRKKTHSSTYQPA